ncbi:U6 snRNA phosphodiesterase isoform X2 [Capsella rubella]|uniref:U6 snRNA phosphodiesterase isoform X2 n=1 Tax=Capsella rubella TaxID=81985 RepID=UPI000CD52A98|nr:U6 snRNA phosphodiesterase isoform X2 [Capsella rubella]
MDALRASYGDASSDSDTDDLSPACSVSANSGEKSTAEKQENELISLPPPPLSLLESIVSTGSVDYFTTESGVRVRNFPHVDGNYALHVYIPVIIPPLPKKEIVCFLKRVASVVPQLHLVEADVPLSILCKDDHKFERALGREFHISLGRSVPLRVHQISSVVSMLKQKLQFHKRYLIDFNKWEVFVNDDCTRSFLSLEITTSGLSEVMLKSMLLMKFTSFTICQSSTRIRGRIYPWSGRWVTLGIP